MLDTDRRVGHDFDLWSCPLTAGEPAHCWLSGCQGVWAGGQGDACLTLPHAASDLKDALAHVLLVGRHFRSVFPLGSRC
jgi:hypothetical protein